MQEVKKSRKKKHRKLYIVKVFTQTDKPNIAILILEFILAIILDTLRLIKNIIKIILGLCIICSIIISIFLYIKIEPIYKEYKAIADEIVNNSTSDDFRLTESSYIYYSNGELMAKLKASQDSTYLEFDKIPPYVIDAFVAVEDRTFWTNPGIDVKGLIRIAVDMIRTKGEEIHGASTITQQLARNIYLTHEVSIERKAKEMLIAIGLTDKYTKREIMEYYINDICYGNAYYGIEAAAKGYFNKSVNELTLSQIAYICAIPNSPEYYNPYKYPDRPIKRRDKILKDMLELNYISQNEYDIAVKENIEISQPSYELNNYETTYAIHCTVEYLMKLEGFEFNYSFDTMKQYNEYKEQYNIAYEEAKTQLYQGGYKIYTTIDKLDQKIIQKILDEKLSFNDEINDNTGIYELQGAITVIDNKTNKVVAIIGGRSQDTESKTFSLNRAFQSHRQPGSSIKPLIVYTPALEEGYTPNSIIKNINVSEAKKTKESLDLLSGEPITMRSALERSLNGAAWYLFYKVTPKIGVDKLVNMEFTDIVPDDYYQASSLGGLTYGVTTVEMASAYSALVNHGFYTKPTCLDKIIDKQGEDIFVNYNSKQIYSQRASDTIIDMMQGVLTRGTAAKLRWSKDSDIEAACKTGTTNDSKDGWLCGVTPQYSISVWVGYDTPKTLSNLYGSTYPGQIWKDSMLAMLNYEGNDKFEKGNYENDIDDYYSMQENYYSYLPGRDDNELLSEGYTVRDHRVARIIGESVDNEILVMQSLDINNPNYLVNLNNQRLVIQSIIDSIYGNTYKAQKQIELDEAYNNCINTYNSIYGTYQNIEE